MSVAELIIGMSFVILLIGLTIPRNNTGYIRAEWHRRRFCSEVRYLKRKALAGTEEYLIIDTNGENNCYTIERKTTVLKKIEVDKDIRIENNITNEIGFNMNGTPTKSGEVRFVYKNKVYRITITPISGRVLLKEGIYSNDTR